MHRATTFSSKTKKRDSTVRILRRELINTGTDQIESCRMTMWKHCSYVWVRQSCFGPSLENWLSVIFLIFHPIETLAIMPLMQQALVYHALWDTGRSCKCIWHWALIEAEADYIGGREMVNWSQMNRWKMNFWLQLVSCPTRWSLYWPLALCVDHLAGGAM